MNILKNNIEPAEVKEFIEVIHRDYPDSFGFIQNRITDINAYHWKFAELNLRDEIGSVINVHNHPDPNTNISFILVKDNETWLEASNIFFNRARQSINHFCPKKVNTLIEFAKKNPESIEPLILEVSSIKPLELKHIDGIHRAIALLTTYNNLFHKCYLAFPIT